MLSKMTGVQIAKFDTLIINADLQRPKRKGKNRIWLQIKQDEPKKWQVVATLSYKHGIDIQFEEIK